MPFFAKTFYEMDSGFGIPVGVVVFVLLIVKLCGGLNFGSGSGSSSNDYKPTDWQKHWAEQEKRKKWKEEYRRKRAETKR